MDVSSPPCAICGASAWTALYAGAVRCGKFGQHAAEPMTVLQCGSCGVGHLPAPAVDYESSEYRELVDGGHSAEHYYALHDSEQPDRLRWIGPERMRDRVVADIGCGAGSFLDLARGLARATLAVEPSRGYHSVLSERGHRVFPYADAVPEEWSAQVDVAVCFSVLEHVEDPLALLKEIRRLLRPGGELVLSTPNLDDWLLEVAPDAYAPFFFRTVHRWYFAGESLRVLARRAGFDACEVEYFHRFDLSNLLLWLRDRRPTGRGRLPVSPIVDAALRGWLEAEGRADYLYARFTA